MDLLERYLDFQAKNPGAVAYASDAHLAGTWRGGWVSRWQRLLPMQADGSFAPAPELNHRPPPGGAIDASVAVGRCRLTTFHPSL